MNIRKNIYDFINDYQFLDPTMKGYSSIIPTEDSSLVDTLWDKVNSIYINKNSNEESDDAPLVLPYLITSAPSLIGHYFSDPSTDLLIILEKIRPEVLMSIRHAAKNLKISSIPISKPLKENPDYPDKYQTFFKTQETFNQLLSEFYYSPRQSIFPWLTNYIFDSIYYSGSKHIDLTVQALFPNIVSKFRITPRLIPLHSDATPSELYLEELKKEINKLRESEEENMLLFFDYEIDTLIGFDRIYSALNYLLETIIPLSTKDEITNCIQIYGDCFKLLYELPLSLHDSYGRRLTDIISKLYKTKISCSPEEAIAKQKSLDDIRNEKKELARKPLDSIVKEMILINNILLPEITAFMAYNLHLQFTSNKLYKNFDNQYIIEQFEKVLESEAFNNYESKKDIPFSSDPKKNALKEKNPLFSSTFLKNTMKDILFGVLPNSTSSLLLNSRIELKKIYRTEISIDSYVNTLYDQIITNKQFMPLSSTSKKN